MSNSNRSILFSTVKADFLERTRRNGFLLTVCLTLYLGYAVNSGQILIKLGQYRGVYNSAWVGGLMAVVVTFFLGLIGFYLVKDAVERDERTGVGQILATTSLSKAQYLLAKWLSNFTLLSALVGILALAALVMQVVQREDAIVRPGALLAPLAFIALPMMALVAACAVLFESVRLLKGGFGNLVYFGLFFVLFAAGVFLPHIPLLDVSGFSLVGASMKAAASAAFADYDGTFTLSMIDAAAVDTFVWPGVQWTAGLVAQRLLYLPAALAVTLAGTLFFDRFDPSRRRTAARRRKATADSALMIEDVAAEPALDMSVRLTPLAGERRCRANLLRLAWLEGLLLVKGQKWYWLAGAAGLAAAGVLAPTLALRNMAFVFSSLWPVLIWAQLGQREAQYGAQQLVYPSASPAGRLTASGCLAGAALSALALAPALLGRLAHGDPVQLLPWSLSALFIPALALALGSAGRTAKAFQVIYPILWYLGPFNPQTGLAVIDYLGLHAQSPVHTHPLAVAGLIAALLATALLTRTRGVGN
jgi:hypothetical protein